MKRVHQRELTLKELAEMPDEAIDTSDIPKLDKVSWANARVVTPEERARVTP